MPKLVKATLSMGDHHLGEGDATPKLEDFPAVIERAYVEMLEAHLDVIGSDAEYDHVILGDWFDLLAVRFEGAYGVVPTEEAALAKAETVLDAHAAHIRAMRDLLSRFPKLRFRIVPGNHDLEFRWPSVQARIHRALAPEGAEDRVTFHEDWSIGETIQYVHGDRFDRLNANPAEPFKEDVMISRKVIALVLVLAVAFDGLVTRLIFSWVPYTVGGIAGGAILSFLTLVLSLRFIAGQLAIRYGRKLTILNVPMASFMHASYGMWLKRRFFPDINRRADHGTIYVIAIARKPYAALIIFPQLLLQAIAHKCIHALRHVRDGLHLGDLRDLVASTFGPDQYVEDLRKFLEMRPAVRHIIGAHTHDPKVVTVDVDGRTVMYYNSGIAGWQVRTSKPDVRCRTRWTRLETFFLRVGYYWTHAPVKAALSTVAYAVLPVTLFLLPSLPVLSALTWPVTVLSLFLLLWWQAAAEYKDTMHFRFAPNETLEYDDGSVRVRGLHYDHEAKRFHLLTGEEAAWDHR